jgi:CRISPR-associated protein Cas2
VNALRLMWLFVMFDVPTRTKIERRRYTKFRKALLRRAFSMLQFSVYARCYPNEEAARGMREQLKNFVPKRGNVRFLSVTDHQFGKMESFLGNCARDIEQPLDQLILF